MASIRVTVATVLALATTPAFAVYKCKDATGRTVFQERRCETIGAKGSQIEVRPASGQPTSPAPSTAATQAAPQTEAARLRTLNERSSKESQLHKLVELEIPAARARIRNASNQCEARMKAVKSQKSRANNNLAGATWEQSISAEMQAIATQCTADQTRANADLDRLLTEKRMLEQELGK